MTFRLPDLTVIVYINALEGDRFRVDDPYNRSSLYNLFDHDMRSFHDDLDWLTMKNTSDQWLSCDHYCIMLLMLLSRREF
jgi:hypothetical protein